MSLGKNEHKDAGIFLFMRPANERRCYIVTSPLIGWAHTEMIPKMEGWNGVYSFPWVLMVAEGNDINDLVSNMQLCVIRNYVDTGLIIHKAIYEYWYHQPSNLWIVNSMCPWDQKTHSKMLFKCWLSNFRHTINNKPTMVQYCAI